MDGTHWVMAAAALVALTGFINTGVTGMPTPQNGTASGDDETTNMTCTNSPPSIENAQLLNSTASAADGESIVYQCRAGYQWQQFQATVAAIQCDAGNWTTLQDTCGDINECKITGLASVCDTCRNTNGTYQCICGPRRQAVGKVCYDACDYPGHFRGTNTTRGTPFLVNSQVFFSCPEGLTILGALSITCNKNASGQSWSAPNPICEAKTKESSTTLSTEAIIGIVVGLVALATLVAIVMCCISRSEKEMHREMDRKRSLVSLRLQEGLDERKRRESEVSLLQPRKASSVTSSAETQFLDQSSPHHLAAISDSGQPEAVQDIPRGELSSEKPEANGGAAEEQQGLVGTEEDIGVSTPPSNTNALDEDVLDTPAISPAAAEEGVSGSRRGSLKQASGQQVEALALPTVAATESAANATTADGGQAQIDSATQQQDDKAPSQEEEVPTGVTESTPPAEHQNGALATGVADASLEPPVSSEEEEDEEEEVVNSTPPSHNAGTAAAAAASAEVITAHEGQVPKVAEEQHEPMATCEVVVSPPPPEVTTETQSIPPPAEESTPPPTEIPSEAEATAPPPEPSTEGEATASLPEIGSDTAAAPPPAQDNEPAETLPAQDNEPAVTSPAQDNEPAVTSPAQDNEPAETLPAQDNEPAVTSPAQDNEPAETLPAQDNEPAETLPAQDNEPAVTSPAQDNEPAETLPAQDNEPAETSPQPPDTSSDDTLPAENTIPDQAEAAPPPQPEDGSDEQTANASAEA